MPRCPLGDVNAAVAPRLPERTTCHATTSRFAAFASVGN